MNRRPFAIEDIFIGSRHRQPDMKKVEEIARSISEVGLMNAPAVCIRDDVVMDDGTKSDRVPVLIYGRHRLLAMQALGRETVECIVHDVDDLHAELMEIDENLARSELSPAEEAAHIRRRQELWEDINGPAKAAGARAANASMGRGDATENYSVAFTTDTAATSGKTDRAIRMAAARGRVLGSDIHRIVGTSLDKGVEMDALIKLPSDERENLIRQAERGEKVSARPAPKPKSITADKALETIAKSIVPKAALSSEGRKARQRQMFWDMWASLDDDVRQELTTVILAQNNF